ncbi:MAG: type III pantothenate kinase, partial [Clostridia bacterium]|nr:type III pantothenate kinase [Clostridia bacterium]
MILTIDIGNTNLTIGAYEEEKCVFVSRLFTDKSKTADEYACDFLNIFSLNGVTGEDFSGCVISNVVPEIAVAVEEACARVTGISPIVLGPGVKTGLNILGDDPAQLGADIVAGCVAAKGKYPVPAIVIDLGTATKITALDKNGSFCGTVICCGVKVALDALAGNASLLTSVKIKAPKKVNTGDTVPT